MDEFEKYIDSDKKEPPFVKGGSVKMRKIFSFQRGQMGLKELLISRDRAGQVKIQARSTAWAASSERRSGLHISSMRAASCPASPGGTKTVEPVPDNIFGTAGQSGDSRQPARHGLGDHQAKTLVIRGAAQKRRSHA